MCIVLPLDYFSPHEDRALLSFTAVQQSILYVRRLLRTWHDDLHMQYIIISSIINHHHRQHRE